MESLRLVLRQRPARAALAIWALLPTLFLFFGLTLAVDPTSQAAKVRVAFVNLDPGLQTPQGSLSAPARLIEGLRQQAPFQVVTLASEPELRAAVLAREVAVGFVFPEGFTAGLRAGQPVQLVVVRSEANDPATNALAANLAREIPANLNRQLPALTGGAPAPNLVGARDEIVAASADFRWALVPATLVLPLWVGTLAFAVLLSRAVDAARPGLPGGWRTAALELATGAVGAAVVAAVVVIDLALFAWNGRFEVAGLWAFLWLGLTAVAWLLQGLIRLLGWEIGALVGVLALFLQQPLSGAAYPPAFAPDAVRWAEGLAPLRYLVEGMRNFLVGGSTTPPLATALVWVALFGLLLYGGGMARVALTSRRAALRAAGA
jgi:uncharacterized phage infection (PIP) family protein YhgE